MSGPITGIPDDATAIVFASDDGVVAAIDGSGEKVVAAGDGNDIRALRGAPILLDYSVGYGDCPAGCIARRTYHFAVHADGTVEYLGASGSPPPNLPQP